MTPLDAGLLFLTMLVLSALPGPSDLAVVSRALESGLRQALLMACGIVAADAVLLWIAVQGWSLAGALPAFWTAAFQLAGAAVLGWFGLAALRHPGGLNPEGAGKAAGASFLAGFLITLGEPEALLFYFALLPVYVEPSRVDWSTGILILLLAATAIFLVKTGYALLARQALRVFRSERFASGTRRAAGILLLVLAAYLVLVSVQRLLFLPTP